MPLASGTRLGSYEVLGTLGAGGMGEVYRARDSRLNREVALKLLPETLSRDVERVARLKREAQVLASLNHPNIAAIFGLEDASGLTGNTGDPPFLVLELVEGPTLADRIAAGRLPLDDALHVARQIAEALQAAHEQAVVHRDLKPANIKLRPDGTVKVLDFGLAKALDPPSGQAPQTREHAVTQSPAITSPAMTQLGAILGTPAYMSPEQASGHAADKRSDIWAFGCVLFEMIAGQRAFRGEDVAETFATVRTSRPDWDRLPAETPRAIRILLERCLEKNRQKRISDIAAALFAIDEATASPVFAQPIRTRAPAWMLSAVLAVVAVAVAVAARQALTRPVVRTPLVRFSIPVPEGLTLGGVVSVTPVVVSPDGRHILVEASKGERSLLYVRSLETLETRPIDGTDGGTRPFWSPDSQSVGFFADGKLKTVNLSGGQPATICDALGLSAFGTWNQDGQILFSSSAAGSPLRLVAASGGAPSDVTVLGPDEGAHVRPRFLPDGRHFFYEAASPTATPQSRTTYVGALDRAEGRRLVGPGIGNAVYRSGYLLFQREGSVLAQRFDLATLTLTGEPVPIVNEVRRHVQTGWAMFSASENGVLAYATGTNPYGRRRLTWFERNGRSFGTLGESADYLDLNLAPDGKHVAVRVRLPQSGGIWIIDTTRGVPIRLANVGPGYHAWSPNGRRLVVLAASGDAGSNASTFQLVEQATDGSSDRETILTSKDGMIPVSWTRDGRYILYSAGGFQQLQQLWRVPLFGDRQPTVQPGVPADPFRPIQAQVSPDGRWLAYESSETGATELYVARFPGPGGKVRVSTSGGFAPRWRGDGKEVFYRSSENQIMAATVAASAEALEIGHAQKLFEVPSMAISTLPYDVTGDGQRFLVNTMEGGSEEAPITVVLNWTDLLTR